MKNLNKNYNAFTLLELVFVIVVLGILAALAIPRMERDLQIEAQDNILSAIRYTQHLALNDNKTDPFDPNWQKKLWKIEFSDDSTFYTISSDTNKDGVVAQDESTIDPSNGKYMFYDGSTLNSDVSPNILIGKLYGINSISFSSNCSSKQIAFDNFGRPHSNLSSASNNYSTYLSSACVLTMSFIDSDLSDIKFNISPETGHVQVID